MSLHVVAEMRAASGQEDRLRTTLEALIEPSLAEEGAISYQPFVDPNDPRHWVMVEEWTDNDALEAHFRTPHFQHAAKVLENVLAEPLVVRRLTPA
ncbi:antibiotic biosynthesis monooxygenase [Nocardia terpenica]|uniref:putative quinol monooxygenase n=1 Tax=Nocardia terpenica TaxID=455432 RepID=UPI001894F2DE|nr:putative quinol monooxygenase [Nocardia terpenica]MBF6066261.1 antibiotic biosynthesis monooxygenase [Nocardia terpenica]MBF6109319.1 antibiotic biosynthesis monooxygenase [Nocardia terpenica]MBF6116559.1 antibiotic biosynthesis monooxygenase [Nocardia terpenica]MBF6123620.1 antibiotic biosynthesis monooxygenase [Nocardia terpenica]MBF6156953.1 antibiotic biosynthesis monooxygenase [Nocardia terpenica]